MGFLTFSPDKGGSVERECSERDGNHPSSEDPATTSNLQVGTRVIHLVQGINRTYSTRASSEMAPKAANHVIFLHAVSWHKRLLRPTQEYSRGFYRSREPRECAADVPRTSRVRKFLGISIILFVQNAK